MATGKLIWGKTAERFYESGDSNVAVYVYDTPETFSIVKPDGSLLEVETNYYNAIAWNGITAVSITPTGGEVNPTYANDEKYVNHRTPEFFGGTIEAYTYPDEWEQCDGSITVNGPKLQQQKRKMFSFVCITRVGSDQSGLDFGEKIHILYNATAQPTERAYKTINDSPEAVVFSWEYNTRLAEVGTVNDVKYKGASYIVLDSRKLCMDKTSSGYIQNQFKTERYNAFKEILFGRTGTGTQTNGYLPMPAEVIKYFLDGGVTPEPVFDGNAWTSLEALLREDDPDVVVRGYTDGNGETPAGYTYPINPRTIITLSQGMPKQVGVYIPTATYEHLSDAPVDGNDASGSYYLETVGEDPDKVTYIMIRDTFTDLGTNIYMKYHDYANLLANTYHFHPMWKSQTSGSYHGTARTDLFNCDADDVREYKTYPITFSAPPSTDSYGYTQYQDGWHNPVVSFDDKVVSISADFTREMELQYEQEARRQYQERHGVPYPYPDLNDYTHYITRYSLESSTYYMEKEAYDDWCNYTGVSFPTEE